MGGKHKNKHRIPHPWSYHTTREGGAKLISYASLVVQGGLFFCHFSSDLLCLNLPPPPPGDYGDPQPLCRGTGGGGEEGEEEEEAGGEEGGAPPCNREEKIAEEGEDGEGEKEEGGQEERGTLV